jgi:hypothetical protein
MPTRRFACLGAALLALSLAAGCAQEQPAPVVASYLHGQTAQLPNLVEVRQTGFYGLFPDGSDTMVARFPLKAGEKIGFARSPLKPTVNAQPNAIYGIAGQWDMPLNPNATYQWRQVPGTTVHEMLPLP